jgi:NAD+ synthase
MNPNLPQHISDWLKDYLNQSNLNCFIVGISGGIDSALVSTLCAQTGKKTLVISMPIHQAEDQLQRAHNHIQWLKEKYSNVESFEFDLTNTFETFKSLFPIENKLALANSRSRLRMVTLYQIAGTYSGLVAGTGNKVEDFGIGFYTKYGDGGVDISPIADLTKTEVRQMACELGIIEEILIAKPTDGLWEDDRSDEDQIGATYEELEWAMSFKEDPQKLLGRQKEVYYIFNKLNKQNKHKMLPIPTFIIKN